MAHRDSNRPIAGAVFGFTEPPKPDSTPPARPVKRAAVAPEGGASPKALLRNRAGENARRKRRERRQRGLPRELQVRAAHVESFGALHGLLQSFNDPYTSGSDLASHVREIPLLEKRLLRTARIQTGHMDISDISAALSLVGNKGLERELLQLLEDMTEVKADLLDKEATQKP